MGVIAWIVLGLGAGVLQHVTWSVNSLCHVFGSRPFATRRHDRATKVRWPTPARLDSRRRCPGRVEPEPVLQPGERRTGRAAASRLSPLPAGGDRIR